MNLIIRRLLLSCLTLTLAACIFLSLLSLAGAWLLAR